MPSLFQFLPHHITARIVSQIVRRSCILLNGEEYGRRDDDELLLPLLWVCRNFREVVYGLYCARYAIDLDRYPWRHKPEWPEWPCCLRKRGHLGHHLAKQLDISVGITSICSGSALKMMCRRPFNGSSFPKVRSIHVVVVWSTVEDIESETVDDQEESGARAQPDTEANMSAFVRQIRLLIPVVNDISVSHSHHHRGMLQRAGRYTRNLAARLFRLPNRANGLLAVSHICMEPPIDTIHNLVRISYDCRDETTRFREQIMQVVRRNAPTLQYLAIKSEAFVNISGLLQDTCGSYVAYCQLNTMKLQLCEHSFRLTSVAASSAIVFPSLRDLTILGSYPFGDDLPFRGNATALESLCIAVTRDVYTILNRHNVFTPVSHPKLRRVSIKQPANGILSHFDSLRSYMNFVLDIAPGASERQFLGTSSWEGLTLVLDMLQNHANIQILALPGIIFGFWEVASLIEWLPVLSELHCLSTVLGPMYEDVAPEENMARLQAFKDLARTRFRRWHIGCNMGVFLKFAVPCVLQLALLCPNFDCVSLPTSLHDEFMTLLEDAIESGEYAGDKPRLRLLLLK